MASPRLTGFLFLSEALPRKNFSLLFLEDLIIKSKIKRNNLNLLYKLSYMNSNFGLTPDYL